MKHKIHNTNRMNSNQLLVALSKAAALYAGYADSTLLFVFRGNKSEKYDYYEVRFGRENFMHLAGIKSKKLKAIEFYEACLSGTIQKEDCNPRRDVKTMYSKVLTMEQLLDFKNSKCYKIGAKDLVTRDNDFEMATGNANGIIGYDKRITIKGQKSIDKIKVAMPTTLLNGPITDYCARPCKIMFILQKMDGEHKYSKLFYEIKKGLFEREKDSFSDELKSVITYE